MNTVSKSRANVSLLLLLLLFASPISVFPQTRVIAPKNPYDEAKDVELGRQAARQAEQKLPLLNEPDVQSYVERVGRRLVESIPAEFQHRQFHYSFKVVDARDLNAFALPGGFTYVNRGLIEGAKNEGEMAGVMAHEISHVALRHGTAQAAKARKYQVGATAIGILGSIFGGPALGQLGAAGVGAYFMKFSREYEKQADILGAQIMANAGYDPHDLANMFRTLEQQGGGRGGPQWMSDHPNPGNRFEYINREADALHVSNAIRNTTDFTNIQALLRDLPRARSMQEIGRNQQRYPRQDDQRYPQDDQRYPRQDDQRYPRQDDQRYPRQDDQRDPQQQRSQRYPQQGGRQQVEYPSSRFRTFSGNGFRVGVPENWREVPEGDNITFAPEGAYSNRQGDFVFTHGIQVGATREVSGSLRAATEQLIKVLEQGNRDLRRSGGYESEYVGSRDGLSIQLSNVSEATGRPEVITVYTAQLRNGELFYLLAVAPREEYQNYQRTFMAILRTVELSE